MALIVEDGTGKEDSDTYVSVVDFKGYAEKRGITLAGDTEIEIDAAVEILLTKAMDYLAVQEWSGLRASEAQALDWPRTDVLDPDQNDGSLFSSTVVPEKVKQAQRRLASDAIGLELAPSGDGRQVLSEKVDALQVTYAESGRTPAPRLPEVDKLLSPFILTGRGSLGSLRV